MSSVVVSANAVTIAPRIGFPLSMSLRRTVNVRSRPGSWLMPAAIRGSGLACFVSSRRRRQRGGEQRDESQREKRPH
jgi:hypothetical protein